MKPAYGAEAPSGMLRGCPSFARASVRCLCIRTRFSALAAGHWRATLIISAATPLMCSSGPSRSASPRSAVTTVFSAAPMRTTDHSLSSRSIGDLPISTLQRAIAARKMDACADTASGELRLTTVNHSTEAKTSAAAAYSRARPASARCSSSCRSPSSFCWATASAASSCWCAFDRFNTDTATQAATAAEITAAGMAPRAPAQIDIHASLSIPQSMGQSLQEVR